MAPLFVVLLAAILGVGALLIFSVWGIPIVVIAVLLAVFYFGFARRADGAPVAPIERGKRIEPTGRPRRASGDAETANQRVGHP